MKHRLYDDNDRYNHAGMALDTFIQKAVKPYIDSYAFDDSSLRDIANVAQAAIMDQIHVHLLDCGVNEWT